MKKELFMRAISLMLAAILCMGLLAPASTAVPAEGTCLLYTSPSPRDVP